MTKTQTEILRAKRDCSRKIEREEIERERA